MTKRRTIICLPVSSPRKAGHRVCQQSLYERASCSHRASCTLCCSLHAILRPGVRGGDLVGSDSKGPSSRSSNGSSEAGSRRGGAFRSGEPPSAVPLMPFA